MTLQLALIYATAFAVTFFLTMLRGFQHDA